MRVLHVVLTALVLMPLAGFAQTSAPGQISYQGRLLKADGTAESGIIPMHFAIYADATTPTPLWSENQGVALTDGYYATALGSVTPFAATVFDGHQRYLGITISGTELLPRQSINAVPYAMTAGSLLATGDTLNVSGYNAAAPQIATKGPALFYFREAEDLPVLKGDPANPNSANNAVVSSDASASGGKYYSLQGNALMYGPYLTLPPGNYRATYRAKVTDNTFTDAAFTLSIHPDSIAEWVGVRQVRGVDFHSANGWQTFSFPFSLSAATAANLEVYLWVHNHSVLVDYLMITPDIDSANNGPWKWGVQVDSATGWQTTNTPTTYATLPASISFVLPRDSWVEARAYGSVYANPASTNFPQNEPQTHIYMRISIDNDTEAANGRNDHSTVMNIPTIWHTAFTTGRWVKLTAGLHTAVLQGYSSAATTNVRFDGNDAITMIVDASPLP